MSLSSLRARLGLDDVSEEEKKRRASVVGTITNENAESVLQKLGVNSEYDYAAELHEQQAKEIAKQKAKANELREQRETRLQNAQAAVTSNLRGDARRSAESELRNATKEYIKATTQPILPTTSYKAQKLSGTAGDTRLNAVTPTTQQVQTTTLTQKKKALEEENARLYSRMMSMPTTAEDQKKYNANLDRISSINRQIASIGAPEIPRGAENRQNAIDRQKLKEERQTLSDANALIYAQMSGQRITSPTLTQKYNDNLKRIGEIDAALGDQNVTQRLAKASESWAMGRAASDVNTVGYVQDVATRQIKEYKDRLDATVTPGPFGTTTVDEEERRKILTEAREAINANNKHGVTLQNDEDTLRFINQQAGAAQKILGAADTMQQKSAERMEAAKQGAGKLGQLGLDVYKGMLDLGVDAALATATGTGSALPFMAERVFGSSTQEARQEGATLTQQGLYGLLSAAASVITEKISNAGDFMTKNYGVGAMDYINAGIVRSVEKLATTEAGRTILNGITTAGLGFLGEGSEEYIESILDNWAKKIYDPTATNRGSEARRERLMEGLVGGLVGALAGVGGTTDTTDYKAQQAELDRIGKLVRRGGDEKIEAVIAEGMNGGENTQALARELQGKIASGQTVTDVELGALTAWIATESAAKPQQNAAKPQQAAAPVQQTDDKRIDLKTFDQTQAEKQNANPTEVNNNGTGTGVLYNDAGRVYSQNPGVETGSMAGEAPGGEKTTAERAEERGLTQRFQAQKIRMNEITELRNTMRGAETVSPASLGYADGSDIASIRRVSEDKLPARWVAAVEGVKMRTGAADVDVVLGQIYTKSMVPVNGMVENGRIIVRADTNMNDGVNTLNHEGNHIILDRAKANGENVAGNGEAALRNAMGAEAFAARVEDYKRRYDGIYDAETPDGYEGIIMEMLADAREGIIRRNADSGTYATLGDDAQQAATDYIDGLAGGNNQMAGATGAATSRLSYGGENARDADLGALAAAKNMRAAGVSAEDTFRETGWFVGMDGRWRFEIDDSGMSIKNKKAETLGEFLNHEELFANYPELADVRIGFGSLPENYQDTMKASLQSAQNDADKSDRDLGKVLDAVKEKLASGQMGYAADTQTTPTRYAASEEQEYADQTADEQNGNRVDLRGQLTDFIKNNVPQRQFTTYEDIDKRTAELDQSYEEKMRTKPREEFQGSAALDALGIKIAGSYADYSNTEQLLNRDKGRKQTEKAAKDAERRLKPTTLEKILARNLASGTLSYDDIPDNVSYGVVSELADYYAALRGFGEDAASTKKAEMKKILDEKVQKTFGDLDSLKKLSMPELNYRTPERIMRHMAGAERGAQIYRDIFLPVEQNESESVRFQNRMLDEVREFTDKTGKTRALTKEEREMTFHMIEGQAAAQAVQSMRMTQLADKAAEMLLNGTNEETALEAVPAERREIVKQYAQWTALNKAIEAGQVDGKIINEAAAKYKEQFDKFYAAINDVLVSHGYEPIGFIKGYAPHMQDRSSNNILQKSLQSLGLSQQVSELPASISGRTADFKPNKRFDPHFLTRKGNQTQYDIELAYQTYVSYAADVIYHIDDIMKVRRADEYIRSVYAGDTISDNIEAARGAMYAPADEKAEFLTDAGVVSSTAGMTVEEMNNSIDSYIAEQIANAKDDTRMSNFVKWLDNYANILAGKQSYASRGREYNLGRESMNIPQKLTKLFAMSKVAGNLSSVVNQVAQLPTIIAEADPRDMIGAISDFVTGKTRRAGWAESSDFLTSKKGVDNLATKTGDKILNAAFAPAQFVDETLSTIAVRTKYREGIRKGLDEKTAMQQADAYGKSVMGTRAKGSKPLAFYDKTFVSTCLNMFQVEALNSWDHITDQYAEYKEMTQKVGKPKAAAHFAGVITKGLLAAFLLNRLTDEVYGGTPAPFDLAGLTANYTASGLGITTNDLIKTIIDNGLEKAGGERLFGTNKEALSGEFDPEAAWEDLSYNIMNDVPLARNASALLGLGDQTLPLPQVGKKGKKLVGAIEGDNAGDITMAGLDLAGEFIPGGNQLIKTAKGVRQLVQGGQYGGKGDNRSLQYLTEDSAFEKFKLIAFGPNATHASSAYYAGEKGLTPKQTGIFEALRTEVGDNVAYDLIKQIGSAEANEDASQKTVSRNIIREADVSDDAKALAYYGLVASVKQKEVMDGLSENGFKVGDALAAMMDVADASGDADKRAAIMDSDASDEVKVFLYKNLVLDEKAEGEKALIDKLSPKALGTFLQMKDKSKKAEKLGVLADAKDLGDNDFELLAGYVLGTEMESEKGESTKYADLLNAMENGASRKDAVELYANGNSLEKYNNFVENGMEPGTAKKVADEMAKLKKNPTEIDKSRAVLNAVSDPKEQLKALQYVMDDTSYMHVTVANEVCGLSPEYYIELKEIMPQYDADGNGSYKQAEITAAINAMTSTGTTLPTATALTNSQKSALWQLVSGSSSAKNNPYSVSTGWDIINARTKAKEIMKEEKENTTTGYGIMLPKA